jgi:hypothetical protein
MKEKKMKRLICHMLIISSIFTFHISSAFSADEVPLDIIDAAQKGIKAFLGAAQEQSLHQFGFLRREDADEATLGEGFPVYTVSPEALLNNENTLDLDELATPTSIWQFLIMTQGTATTLLTVDFMNDKWTAVSIGASGLAKELYKLLETWPPSAGYQYKLIRIYQGKSELIEIWKGDKVIAIIPSTSARVAFGIEDPNFDPLDVYDSTHVLTNLRSIVRETIQVDQW